MVKQNYHLNQSSVQRSRTLISLLYANKTVQETNESYNLAMNFHLSGSNTWLPRRCILPYSRTRAALDLLTSFRWALGILRISDVNVETRSRSRGHSRPVSWHIKVLDPQAVIESKQSITMIGRFNVSDQLTASLMCTQCQTQVSWSVINQVYSVQPTLNVVYRSYIMSLSGLGLDSSGLGLDVWILM